MILQEQKLHGPNGGFHSEYVKLDRFLSAINLNLDSIEVGDHVGSFSVSHGPS